MKHNLGKKLLALFLTAAMLVGMAPAMTMVSAAETVTWTKCADRFTEEDGIVYLDIFLNTRSKADAALIPEIAEGLFAEKENYTWKLTASDTTVVKTEVYTVLPAAYCILNNGVSDYPAFRFAVCGGETDVFTPAYNHSYKCALDIYAEDALLYSTGEMAQVTCTVDIHAETEMKWSLEDGVLTVYAGVEMENYNSWDNYAPWYSRRDEITSVVLEDGVTRIGSYAFNECSSLTSVTIPDSVTFIGWDAFEWCSSLTSVTIPDSVTAISWDVFYGCSSLTDIYCEAAEQPAGWNEYWLDGCHATVHWGSSGPTEPTEPTYPVLQLNGEQFITEDTIFRFTPTESGTYKFYSTDRTGDPYGYLYDADYYELTHDDDGNGNYNFKIQYDLVAGRTYYFKASFYGGSGSYTVHLEKIDIVPIASDDAITISKDTIFQFTPSESGEYRFYVSDYTGLGYLTAQFYPEDRLSGRFFDGFSSFKEGLEAGKTYYLYVGFVNDRGAPSTGDAPTEGVYAINAKSESCTVHLKKIEPVKWSLEDGVLTIHAGVEMDDYNGWDNLAPWYNRLSEITSVVLEDGVTKIGERAFSGCTSLTSVTIGDSVTSIGSYAFSDCTSLTSITVAEGNPSYCSIDGILYSADKTELIYCPAGKAGHVTIPDGVISIGRSAFYECSALTSVTIGNSVTSIGEWAFGYCSALTSVTIGNSVTDIGDYAFYHCSSLTTITVAEDNTAYCSMDGILYSADKTELIFCPAGKAGHVTIPDSVTRIGNDAFSWCYSLTSVTIPDSVTRIGYRAFYDCSALTSVTIPDSVTRIDDDAFSACYSLTSVTIPDSVTSIGESAFWDCYFLTDIYCEAAEQPAGWNEDWLYGCHATVHWGWKGEESIPGDINGDHVLSIMDVTALLVALAMDVPGDGNIALYDMTGDKIISIQDVTKLLQMLAQAA